MNAIDSRTRQVLKNMEPGTTNAPTARDDIPKGARTKSQILKAVEHHNAVRPEPAKTKRDKLPNIGKHD